MRNNKRAMLQVDALESRSLLSGFSSPAVQADLLKIKADEQVLRADLKAQQPTLKKDAQAIDAAIAANMTVQTDKATLATDLTAAKAAIKKDIVALITATDAASRTAAITQLQTDSSTFYTKIKADGAAIDAAIKADGTIQAAIAQLKADTNSTTIAADRATLDADYAQLKVDLKAAKTGT